MALVVSAAAAVAAAVAAWPMLHLLRVRPAWPVALLGPIALGGLSWLMVDGLRLGWAMLPLASSLAYGLAAIATDAELRWPWRLALVVLVVAAYPLAPLLRDHRSDTTLQRTYAQAGVPLMAPDLDEYLIADPAPDPTTHQFRYKLRNRSVHGTSTGEWVPDDISVVVGRIPATFAPPRSCPTAEADRSARRCQPVTADTWRVAEDNAGFRTVTYLVRREDALTAISGMGWNGVPEDAMRRAAQSLRSRPPSFFTS